MWLSLLSILPLLSILLLSGISIYFIVQRTARPLTRVPLWILWVVLMIPPTLTGVTATWSKQVPILPIAIGVCSICSLLYWQLLSKSWGTDAAKNPILPPAEIEPDRSISEVIPPVAVELTTAPPIMRPIEPEEEATLRTCFAWNVFFLDKIEYRPQAVLCRGKLRTDADNAYATVNQNIEELFGDRFFVLFQYSLSTGKPFFALVPRPQFTKITRSRQRLEYAIAGLLLLLTIATTTYFGARLSNSTSNNLSQIVMAGWTYSISIISIIGIRDLGRYFVAKFYKIDTDLPYLIPLPFPYGSLMQIRSPIPTRKAIFDLGFVAASLGLLIATPLLLWGLSQSAIVPIDPKSTLFSFQAFNPRFSLLLTLVCKLALGSQFVAERAINLHSVAIAAYVGLLAIIINLIPLRRSDGGYVVHGMFGQKPSAIISQLSKIILVILGIIRLRSSTFGHMDFLVLAIVISLIPTIDEPALNDVSELNNWRDNLGVIILAVLVLALIPVPAVLMQLLDI